MAYVKENYYPVLLLWFMWPATALMITSAITAVLLKWRSIVDSFRHLRCRRGRRATRRTCRCGPSSSAASFSRSDWRWCSGENFGMSYLQTAVAVACSLPLILVGVRVLGETNNGPISVMMNGLQAVFAVFFPGHSGHNLIAAGMVGFVQRPGAGDHSRLQDRQDHRLDAARADLGATRRRPHRRRGRRHHVPVADEALCARAAELPAPTGIKIAGMAILISQGVEAFPHGALLWTVIAAVVGILIPVIQHYRRIDWLPSAAGFGFGLILPGTLNIPMAIGGILGWLWARQHKPSYDRYVVTVASGFIAGEAILGGLVIPAVSWFFPDLLGP